MIATTETSTPEPARNRMSPPAPNVSSSGWGETTIVGHCTGRHVGNLLRTLFHSSSVTKETIISDKMRGMAPMHRTADLRLRSIPENDLSLTTRSGSTIAYHYLSTAETEGSSRSGHCVALLGQTFGDRRSDESSMGEAAKKLLDDWSAFLFLSTLPLQTHGSLTAITSMAS